MMTFPTEWKVIKFHGSKSPTSHVPIFSAPHRTLQPPFPKRACCGKGEEAAGAQRSALLLAPLGDAWRRGRWALGSVQWLVTGGNKWLNNG